VRVGFFGGTFDPPHISHLLFCVWALEMAGLDKVLWAPAVEHPFGKGVAPFEDRLAMSRLTARLLAPRVEVSDIERHLPTPSYTVNTILELRRRMPGTKISVLVGSDIVAELDKWARIEELRRLADFIVVPRGGYAGEGDADSIALPLLSSTAVREALREGRSVAHAVTPAVREYIERRGLYR
jgi:nicotinate-nucleotide adenylyltransferase